jgi:hypothetical protein
MALLYALLTGIELREWLLLEWIQIVRKIYPPFDRTYKKSHYKFQRFLAHNPKIMRREDNKKRFWRK